MSRRSELAEALASPGPWTTAYIDGLGDEPQTVEEAKQESLLRDLSGAGAPEADRQAIRRAIRDATGIPSPSARYLLVRDGAIVVDTQFAEARRGPAVVAHGAVPFVLPLLRHRAYSPRYLVVETSRDGADIRVERAGRAGAERTTSVEGSTDSLPKVQAGGWSHSRWQRHSEEVWKHNQSEVGQEVERAVREVRPAFIVLSGDLRARQLLREHLSPDCVELLIDVDAHTRADGADDAAVERAIATALDEGLSRDLTAALDAANAGDGDRRATGVAEVVGALQQARVDELIIDARWIDAPSDDTVETLGALDAEPWIRDGAEVPGTAQEIARVQPAEALARAAVLTRARVRIIEEQHDAADEPRDGGSPRPPIALLRW